MWILEEITCNAAFFNFEEIGNTILVLGRTKINSHRNSICNENGSSNIHEPYHLTSIQGRSMSLSDAASV